MESRPIFKAKHVSQMSLSTTDYSTRPSAARAVSDTKSPPSSEWRPGRDAGSRCSAHRRPHVPGREDDIYPAVPVVVTTGHQPSCLRYGDAPSNSHETRCYLHSGRKNRIDCLRVSLLRVWLGEPSRLQTHVAHGVAPVAVAGAAADGADLERVVAAGTECLASSFSSGSCWTSPTSSGPPCWQEPSPSSPAP